MAADRPARERPAENHQAVRRFVRLDAERGQRAGNGREAVTLLDAQTRRTGKHGLPLRTGSQQRQRRREVGNVRNVDLAAAQWRGGNSHGFRRPAHMRAEAAQQLQDLPVALCGRSGKSRNGHGTGQRTRA